MIYQRCEADDNAKERKLQKRPICCICKEHIQDEQAIYYNDEWCHNDRECSSELWDEMIKEFLENVEEL